MTDRLSLRTLVGARLGPGVTPPAVDPGSLSIGIVHFGLGAFHRAHQALYTEEAAAATGDTRWGILGVTGRSDAVVRQLQPQDGVYGVMIREARDTSLHLVGSIRDVAWPGDRSGDVVDTLARGDVHLATLTITESGYDVSSASPDRDRIREELAGAPTTLPSTTPVGLLVRGLARRFRGGGDPFTALCCDNLTQGGDVLRAAVHTLADSLDDGFDAWLDSRVRFPSSMVDRLTPATSDADRDDAERILGLRDEALVVAEPFRQWVIEDRFAGPRPAWERAGAILTDDVAPYEELKLRVLNAAHLLFAWAGTLRGYATIAEAAADPELVRAARVALDDDILPTLVAPDGIDLEEYRDTVLARFADPALNHATRQVGSDGSLKVPVRLGGTIRDRLAAGSVPRGIAFILAAWARTIAENPLPDPLADSLRAAVGDAGALEADPETSIRRLFAVGEIIPAPARDDDGLIGAVADAVRDLQVSPMKREERS